MPRGKKHKPNVSRAQQRKKFALAERGEMSMADAEGSASATKKTRGGYSGLPEHKRSHKKKK